MSRFTETTFIFASMNRLSWRQLFFWFGLLGALLFLVLTGLAMYLYPGGTIHAPELESYSFLNNYFSDLGRTKTFDGLSNRTCHSIFKAALTISGFTLILFFIALPSLFSKPSTKMLITIAAVLGIVAGVCYIGIGWVPWNEDYWVHRRYVRISFLAFLGMTLLYTTAIFSDPNYPNKYGRALLTFFIVLLIQIIIMFFGPRAYRTSEALFLQAVAQKIVVYAEILVMVYMAWGAIKLEKRIYLPSDSTKNNLL